ncbi:MAG: hypothetical protein O7A65_09920, partial [Proteobacteria bacterium]|nr:hypothetical protein [Pseudomonadota bacterium]
MVKNGDASAHTATVTVQDSSVTVAGFGALTKTNPQVSVPASGERWIGPFAEAFNDATGFVQVTYDAVTSVTVAAIKVPGV